MHRLISLFFGIGMFLRFKIDERQFNRDSKIGLGTLFSYKNSVTTEVVEKVLGVVANVLIFIGSAALIISIK